MVITRKIQLYPEGDKDKVKEIYDYIKDGQYKQHKIMNLLMSQVVNIYYQNDKDIKCEAFKNEYKNIFCASNTIFSEIGVPKGVDMPSATIKKVKKDFESDRKNGLAKGERSVRNYKRTGPLLTRGRDIKLRHKYKTDEEFKEHLMDEDVKLCMAWVHKYKFKVILGDVDKSKALRSEIGKIFDGDYKICDSSIEVDKKKIYLHLCLEIPDKVIQLDENIVVGVDVGVTIPAYCALNNNDKIKDSYGSKKILLDKRTKIQTQRRRLQKQLTYTSGGHGRKKKLRSLDRLKDQERNFVQTYNHKISKDVVNFALKHNAKYINIEDLSSYKDNANNEEDKNKRNQKHFILRNWSYYELQTFITYKAKHCGIEVRKVNPAYTSQTCSCCGNVDAEQRIDQAHFKCKKCGKEMNADFNAARNIAMSMEFVKDKKEKE